MESNKNMYAGLPRKHDKDYWTKIYNFHFSGQIFSSLESSRMCNFSSNCKSILFSVFLTICQISYFSKCMNKIELKKYSGKFLNSTSLVDFVKLLSARNVSKELDLKLWNYERVACYWKFQTSESPENETETPEEMISFCCSLLERLGFYLCAVFIFDTDCNAARLKFLSPCSLFSTRRANAFHIYWRRRKHTKRKNYFFYF